MIRKFGSVTYFKELKRFSKNHLCPELADKLILNKILKIDENSSKKYSEDLYFDYTGVIISGDFTAVVLPKYLDSSSFQDQSMLKSKTKMLMAVLKKYARKSVDKPSADAWSPGSRLDDLSLPALYDFFINDYMEYGLYESEKEFYEIDGEGETDWEKTVCGSAAYLTKSKKPVYLERFTYERNLHDEDYISILHKMFLNNASEYFEKLAFLGFDYPRLDFFMDKSTAGDIQYQIFRIDQEMREEFSERKIRLLKAMKLLLENGCISREKGLTLYGTKFFYNVWEKACQQVLLADQELKNKIPKPVWRSIYSSKENIKDTLIPDIVRKIGTDFFILDAKYYDTGFDEDGSLINKHPGIGDITKQFLYESAFEKHFNKKKQTMKFYNVFLMPWENEKVQCIGKITLEIFKDREIKIFKLPASKIFEGYLNDETFDSCYDIFKK